MAGSIDGETKMEIAKREAVSFLSELDENISVGLVVYGHRGNNKEDGKAESCVQDNANRISQACTRATILTMGCYNKNNPQRLQQAVTAARRNAAEGDPLYQECGPKMLFEASGIATSSGTLSSTSSILLKT